jgi:uncharacterized protein with PIN domain
MATAGDTGAADTRVLRFAADRMLGRLARWLRVLGHDVSYGPHLAGRTLLASARREQRLVLTRDTRLRRARNAPPLLFLTSDDFREQLRQVARAVPLANGPLFGRCLECNRMLEEVAREAVRDRVPAYVFATAGHFHRCSRCGRLYWPATHHAHMRRELETLGLGKAS